MLKSRPFFPVLVLGNLVAILCHQHLISLQSVSPSVSFSSPGSPQSEEWCWAVPRAVMQASRGAGATGHQPCGGEYERQGPPLARTRGEAVGRPKLRSHTWLGKCGLARRMRELMGPGCLESISGCNLMLPSFCSQNTGVSFSPIPHFDGLYFSGRGTRSCSSSCPQHMVGT